ncbi:MAG: UDP-3-O-(3-hydroxymyristoyl)glucosamine N-acyltransferase [Rubrivivax sp.]|nr:UDP-3-O-(3-hydroxymyristoyl)glucosamine N-acyltransferase [Rubrivivax sp.]
MQAVAVRLADLVAALGGDLVGDGNRSIDGIAPIDRAGPSHITFLAQARLAAQIERTGAGCVVVRAEHRDAAAARTAAIVTADPYLYFARLTQWWAAQSRPAVAAGIHPSAVVEPGAHIDASASVGALAFVGTGARIGAGAVLGAQAFVGAGAEVGAHTRLGARVVLESGCRIGQRGIVQPGAVIGGDGFGFAPHQGQWVKIEQLGGVRIGDDVEIGANTCIDRGALDDTVIEDGVKLDNLIQIGHNCVIGAHTAMAGCTGVAGSTRIGRHCTAGGSAMILGHLEIADHVHISAATVVSRSIRKPGQYSGFFPIDDNATWEKNAATLKQLHQLRDRIRALENKP